MYTFRPTAEAGPHGEVQRWAVPPGCVRLAIDASGAQGGDGSHGRGGRGARVVGSVDAGAAGVELRVLVGQRGE